MTTERRFAAFRKGVELPRMKDIPEGGFCLSAFLIMSKTGSPSQVLMGRIKKEAPWNHLGALDPERVEMHRSGWMLPSSHLILGESPQQAAERILKEQLGLSGQKLRGPFVVSEVYDIERAGLKNHWDIGFLFLGERDSVIPHEAWAELKFIDLTEIGKEEIARSHEDILAYAAGLRSTAQ